MATPSQIEMFNNLANRSAPAPRAGPPPAAAAPPPAAAPKPTFADAMAKAAQRAPSEVSSVAPPSTVAAPSTVAPSVMAPSTAAPPAAGFTVPPTMSRAEEDMEKHSTLLELEHLRQSGAKPTRTWTMNDPLDDMVLEARKLRNNMDEAEMVNMMRDFLKLGFTGIEFLNDRVHMLELDGWSNAVSKDVHKYDAALAKIYRKYWRRSTATPEMELLMGIGTSLFTHHCKNKFAKKARAPRASAPAPAPADVPFHMPADGSDSEDEMPPPGVVQVDFENEK